MTHFDPHFPVLLGAVAADEEDKGYLRVSARSPALCASSVPPHEDFLQLGKVKQLWHVLTCNSLLVSDSRAEGGGIRGGLLLCDGNLCAAAVL